MPTLRNTTTGDSLLAAIGGVQPAAGDTVLITEGAAHYVNGLAIDTNEINKLVVGSTFEGSIGTSGSACEVDLAGSGDVLVIDGGGGSHFFEAGGAGADIDKAIVLATRGGKAGFTGGTVTKLEQADGDTWVQGGCVLTNADGGGGVFRIDDNATAVTLGDFEDMQELDLRRGFTTLTLKGCYNAKFEEIDRAAATINGIMSTLAYNGGTITALNAGSKFTLDLRTLQQDITITGAELWPSCKVLFPTGPYTVTFPASPTLVGGGPAWYVA